MAKERVKKIKKSSVKTLTGVIAKKKKLKTSRKVSSQASRRPIRAAAPLMITEVVRSYPRQSQFSRLKAYYSMGLMTLALGLLFCIYEEFNFYYQASLNQKIEHKIVSSSSMVLHEEFQKVQELDLGGRIQFWSAFLEKNAENREELIHLVKGRKIEDSAPLVPAKYNCTTYVETVASLARSGNSDEFLNNILMIRYRDAKPGFAQRNHFAEADWIPNNIRAKILTDITGRVAASAGMSARLEAKQINRAGWLNAQIHDRVLDRHLASLTNESWSRPVDVQIPYIELSKIKKVLAQIPNGTILNLVHKNDLNHPVLITHQGFVIREGNKVFLRHATLSGTIHTMELTHYLRGLLSHQKAQKNWPLIGVNLNQISDSASTNNLRSEAM